MDGTLFQLRSFVHQRLSTAAEEIVGELEATITLVLYEAKEEVDNLRHQLYLLQEKSAEDPPLISRTAERGTECEAPLLQQNPGPSSAEPSSFSAEAPGFPQTTTDMEKSHWNDCVAETGFNIIKIKEEQEELWESSQAQNFVVTPSEIVKGETQTLHEIHSVPFDCSGAQCEDEDRQLVKSQGEQTEKVNWKGQKPQDQRGNTNCSSASPYEKCSKNEEQRSFCHLCGKGFLHIGPLMKHIKTHEKKTDCTVCGITYRSTKQLITHLKRYHNETPFCGICAQSFPDSRHLQQHERMHTGKEDFTCQECGKTFRRRDYLIVHVRTHSGEKPYQCDVCSKAFTQSQHLLYHKRAHTGEKPYPCSLCDKHFSTTSKVKIHMRYHLGEKPYPCDICGKRFHESRHVISHKIVHTGERPYVCHVCGKRYRFAPSLKEHLQLHEKAAAQSL
ncbi:zinc finger protein 852-like [Brachionichthys hirsutus]|uniref:zinc finger protein 852-like n=1 Tax=Brachionichthys hirsutus TaxID=412623 RepID=UPI003604EE62